LSSIQNEAVLRIPRIISALTKALFLIFVAISFQTMPRGETSLDCPLSRGEEEWFGSRGENQPDKPPDFPATWKSDRSEWEAPEDTCLPSIYKDWYELNRHVRQSDALLNKSIRIVIDRSMFNLLIEEMNSEGDPEEIYRTQVALGDLRSPTPVGTFIINHIYCYPDVLFFGPSQQVVPHLYHGFFAPLLLCQPTGTCERFRDLGIHGFLPDARPNSAIRPETFGAVSAGCIRLPDPCAFKHHLLRRVDLGPLKRNDRGSYHWLKKPVEVLIVNGYTGNDHVSNFLESVTSGLGRLEGGIRELLQSLGR
jgi:hypothetical protein